MDERVSDPYPVEPSIEEGFKLVMSAGLVSPDEEAPDDAPYEVASPAREPA